MELTIGERTINAAVVETGTYVSEKSKKELRDIKVVFGIYGADALDQYRELSIDAVRYGVASDDAFWIATEYLAQWQQAPPEIGGSFYEAMWRLRESEN